MKLPYWTLLTLLCFVAGAAEVEPARAKLLHTGWDFTNNKELREHWQEMEAQMPFDGVIFPLLNADGYASSLYIWNAEDWSSDIFAGAVADLKSCKFQRFTDNFALAWVSPGPMDWFDDAAWGNIAHKFAILARAAKDAGLKGICFDPEPYMQFNWRYDPASGRSFDDTAAIARRRGVQIMDAIGGEYPDITFLSFWMFSLPSSSAARETLKNDEWGLYFSFLNGLWEAAPETARIVDAAESGYVHRDDIGALLCYNKIKRGRMPTLEPGLRDKYRRQISAGFGFYIEPYGKGWIQYDQSTLRGIRRDLETLLAAADDYVWFYSESGRWFGATDPAGSWEGKVPGITRTLRLAADPGEILAALPVTATSGTSELEGFQPVAPEAANAIELQFEPGKGTWLTLKNPQTVLFTRGVPVKPGESYRYELEFLPSEDITPELSIRWHSETIWTGIESHGWLEPEALPNGNRRISGILRVPDHARQAIFFLACHSRTPQAKLFLSSFKVEKLDDIMDHNP